jgi:hypothetical protein
MVHLLERIGPITSGKLRPLREHIRQTDKLIDALAYELYGQTEEEIGIVEGT